MTKRLVSDWYPVEWADADGRPAPFVLEGKPLVRWRAPGGWRVFEDRCPHRNAPLSAGRRQDGTLVCPYHGWRFDGAGRCVWVPALGRAGKPSWAVPSLQTRVVDGLIFAGPEDRAPPQASLPEGGHRVRLVRSFQAPLERVAENILDVPHTATLHGGLFRRAARRSVRVEVERGPDRVVARYPPESPRGVVARLFGPGAVEHEDEFRVPGLALVRYARGPRRLTIASWLSVVDEDRTQLHVSAVLSGMDRWAPFLERVVLPVARRILEQDVWMLARQTDTIRAFGGPRFIHAHDVMTRHISHLRSDRAQGRLSSSAQEVHQLWV